MLIPRSVLKFSDRVVIIEEGRIDKKSLCRPFAKNEKGVMEPLCANYKTWQKCHDCVTLAKKIRFINRKK